MTFAYKSSEVITQAAVGGNRPRILDELVLLPTEEGLLIEGFATPEMIRGPVAQTILPDLTGLMDGTRTVEDLFSHFSSDLAHYVHAGISFVKDSGLIRKQGDYVDPPGSNPDTLAFLRRSIAAAGLNKTGFESCEILQHAEVSVLAQDGHSAAAAEYVKLLLEQTGVGSVRIIKHPGILNSDTTLAVDLSTRPEDNRCQAELAGMQSSCRLGRLRSVLNETAGHADIGPLFMPGGGTCCECFRAVHDPWERSDNSVLSAGYDAGRYRIWASLIVWEIIHILSLPSLALTGRQFRRFQLAGWQSELLNYPRLPGCTLCRKDPFLTKILSTEVTARLTDTAIVFEDYIALESRAELTVVGRERFAQSDSHLSDERRSLPNCRRIPLSRTSINIDFGALDSLTANGKRLNGRVDVDVLSLILAMTAGIREIGESAIRRWAATAGNLGSVEVVALVRDVEGLSKGIYFYQPDEHSLAAFRKRGGLPVEELMRRAAGYSAESALPNVLLILTGAFFRLAPKYGSFGYRLINLDSGAAVSQLSMVARSLGVSSHVISRWADDLIESELNLSSEREQTTAVIELRHGQSAALAGVGDRSSLSQPCIRYFSSCHSPQEFRGLNSREITEKLRREARISESDLHLSASFVPERLLNRRPEKNSVTKLPRPLRSGLSVGGILRNRKSIREYSGAPLDPRQLGTLLHYAHSLDAFEWKAEHEVGLPLTYLVLARRVTGLQPGVYQYEPLKHALLNRAPPLSTEETVELLVQSEYAGAPVLIWIAGNLAAACARHGAHGHRQLLFRAGAAGHRLWMTALGIGLKGSILAGLIPGAARNSLTLDGYKSASLFGFTAGH